ncbi:IclR family transcriptional regulator [Gordonia sp. (in: high G+C Gram-positive bacteria)]|uniref:IclR family transcriptional regulator n=1 Tax=unclassified Gordonia (in: high G+C Gram-positive bacteria) TaxID=2657482 RepID=UPI0026046EDC|nr:IclR family transcriptional regulator [Gordonia sp. (in: high G+C Gram-positive bacteria)]
MTSPEGARSGVVQSVDRAVSILEVVARTRSIGVTAIATELGLSKTTVSRLLATLEGRGLVEQNEVRGEYSLGYTAWMLSSSPKRRPDLVGTCRPFAADLARRAGETVNIAVLDNGEVMTVDQVAGDSAIGSIDWVGRRTPAHATAAGKVLLACLPEAQRAEFLPDPLPRFTEHTVTDRTRLARELEDAADTGIAYTFEENEIGEVAVGAPIRDFDGHAFAAVTLAGPAFRVTDKLPMMSRETAKTAAEISWRFGWQKSS